MASDDLTESNNHATPTQTLSSPSSDSPHLPASPLGHATSPTDNQGFLSSPARDSLDSVGSPSSHTSHTSSLQPPPPSPTLSAYSSSLIRFATSTGLRDNNLEEHDELSSLKLLAPPPPHHRRKGSMTTVSSAAGSASTEREYEDDQSFRPSPVTVRSAPDATSILPSPTHTRVDVVPGVPLRPSSPATFLRKTLDRVQQSSPSPSGETDTDSDTTRNDGQKGDSSLPTALQSSEDVYRTSIEDRKRNFDQNIVPQRPSKILLQLMWLALKDKVLILLSIAAVVLLSLGLFRGFGQPRPEGEYDGVAAVSVAVGSKTETAFSNFARRNFGCANYKDSRNGTNLNPFSRDLKAILYNKIADEVITPGWMRGVVVFYNPRLDGAVTADFATVEIDSLRDGHQRKKPHLVPPT